MTCVRRKWGLGLGLALQLVLTASAGADPEFPAFEEPALAAGRVVWLGTCRNCHATGFADAPPVTDIAAWESRLAKSRDTLHTHALNGFYGEDYAYMPPRGGNDALSDQDVKNAVDYMLRLVKTLHEDKSNGPGKN